MSNKERLGRKGVRLNVHVTAGNLVHETGLTHVGETTHENGTRVGVKRWETRHVLAHFLQVGQRGLLAFQDGTHTSESGAFETLAAVERVTVLDHADHVAGNRVDQRSGGIDLAESKFVVIAIVQGVTQIGVKGMNVIQSRKLGEDITQSIGNGLLSELDLSNAAGGKDETRDRRKALVKRREIGQLLSSRHEFTHSFITY